jgi:protein involved in polysaccharide export with SLBB domain
MKKLLLMSLFFPLTILSQNLDEAYLESLPDDIRKDVLQEMESTSEDEKTSYRRPTSMVEQQKILSERLAIARSMLEEIGTDLEDNDINKLKKPQKRYGNSIFNLMQSSFMPINEPNLDGSYVLDFGDVLEIQLISQKKDFTKKIPVKRDGSIAIPDIGKVFVSGLSLESASELIKNKVDSVFIGTKAFISLVNVRDIQIIVSGNAVNPGVYTLNGNSNLLHSISMAGGIDDFGSYRKIDVIRNGAVVDTIDLYDVFIYGKPNFGPKLRSGDSVFIQQAEILVNVVSGVNRPHIYELKKGENFEDAINFANDFKSTANLEYISIQRLEDGDVNLIELNLQDLANSLVQHRDIIIVREYEYGTVTIEGAVNAPGEYSISRGTTLKDILKRAGGYKATAYPFGGYLDNQKTADINKEARDRLYGQFIKNLARNLATLSSESSGLPILMNELKKSKISGRIMAEFDLDMIEAYPNLDTVLEDQDKIMIPYITQQVYVYGEISNQGSVRYVPGKDINYYLKNAGGILETGDRKTVFVVHPNGKTERISKNSFGFNKNNNVLMYPGSIIYIPQSGNLLDNIQTAAVWAPIISSIALSLTSLSVLNND